MYYEEYCNAIYETCEDFLSKELPVFSPFQKKNAFWFDSSDTKMKDLLKSRDLLAELCNQNQNKERTASNGN